MASRLRLLRLLSLMCLLCLPRCACCAVQVGVVIMAAWDDLPEETVVKGLLTGKQHFASFWPRAFWSLFGQGDAHRQDTFWSLFGQGAARRQAAVGLYLVQGLLTDKKHFGLYFV